LRQEDNTDKSTECESLSPESTTKDRRSLIMNKARLSIQATLFAQTKSSSQNSLNSPRDPASDQDKVFTPINLGVGVKNKRFSEDFSSKGSPFNVFQNNSKATGLSKFGSNPNSRPGLQLNMKPDEQSNTSLTFPGLHGSQELRGSFLQQETQSANEDDNDNQYYGFSRTETGKSRNELDKLNEDSISEEEQLESLYDSSEKNQSTFYQPLFLKNLDNEIEQLKEELQIDENQDIYFIRGDFFVYYEEGNILGEGTSGTVKKCTKTQTNEAFAVKIVRYRGDTELLHIIVKEFKHHRKLNHKNIIKVYELYIDYITNRVYMVMELAECQEMFEVIKDLGNYSESIASGIFKQFLSGINYLHSNGVCHRDLKPHNILVSRDGKTVKITDFNVSKFSGDKTKGYTALSKANYKMWTYTGTVAFTAPEVFDGSQYTEAVDMWSAGVVLYTMLCGYQPFQAETIQELTELIIQGKYEFHPESWDNISEQAKDLIKCLLQVDYKERYSPFQALMHPWVANHGKVSNQSICGAIENLWAYLNRNSKNEKKNEEQNSNQEKIEWDASGSKSSNKNNDSKNMNSILKLTQIQVRSRAKNAPANHESTPCNNDNKNQTISGKKENKKNKDFYFVNYVSSIEKSHSSTAIEGKYLKRLGSRKESGEGESQKDEKVYGLKCFSTAEDLPRVFTTNNNQEEEDYEENIIDECGTIKEDSCDLTENDDSH